MNDEVQADWAEAAIALARDLDGLPPAELEAPYMRLDDFIHLERHAAASLGGGAQLSTREGPHTREDDPPYEIDFYEDNAGRKPALEWLQGLERRQRRIVGSALREILEHQGINICSTSFGRQLGEGLFEFRLREEELLVRIFCHAHGQRLILVLGGYDKGKDPAKKRQEAEIAEARRRLKAWTARQRGG